LATSDANPCEFCQSPTGHGEERDWFMPLTLDASMVERMGRGVWGQIPAGRPVHLVVVATGGVSMGLAAAAVAPAGLLRSVTVVKRAFDFDSPQLRVGPGESVIVLDNSMHSGRSVATVIGHLQARQVPVESVITIFDGANDCESQARKRIEDTTGVPVLACAGWSERHSWA
jgi:orotate phosphoribosyltransferase